MDIYTDDVSLIRVELAWMIRGKPINFKDGEELLVRGEKDGRGKISETHLRALWGKMKPRTSKKAWGDPLWLGQLASCLVNDLKVLTSEQLRQSAREDVLGRSTSRSRIGTPLCWKRSWTGSSSLPEASGHTKLESAWVIDDLASVLSNWDVRGSRSYRIALTVRFRSREPRGEHENM